MDEIERAEEASFETLQEEGGAIRERLERFVRSLSRYFVGREDLLRLLLSSSVAQVPLLLVGPPGTAKSDLVVKFREALGVPNSDYFEYMLTRFTEPSELFGPIDLQKLKDGKYIRKEQGKLPTARVVFLDEIFMSSSAILNALLTVINERKFYQDGAPQAVKLKLLFAASNDVPSSPELRALKDRFVLKALCRPVESDRFFDLLRTGSSLDAAKELGQKPWAEGHATLADLVKAHRYLTLTLARESKEDIEAQPLFRRELLLEFRRLLRTLATEDEIYISDRKIVRLYRLLRAHAWLVRGGTVEAEDLRLLSYLGDSAEEMERIEAKVPALLGFSAG